MPPEPLPPRPRHEPPALPRPWRLLHWLALALAMLAGLLLLPPTSAFGSSGYGGYGQIAVMLVALAGSALAALGGLVASAVCLWRGPRRPLLLAGLALDAVVLGTLAALAARFS